ncbi:uncharacterized protein LOC142354436 [Convolutriloba macropyga]|uniref:uncharacterized protein LOC142354436 n=1 Tax=Convolutriloba macropyga TaxID=536237 RepID=UPI003F521A8B
MKSKVWVLSSLITLLVQRVSSGGVLSSFMSPYESLRFQIPSQHSAMSKQCQQYSDHFCLTSWLSNYHNNNREPSTNDYLDFWSLLLPVYYSINWFPLNDGKVEKESCCTEQFRTYTEFGQSVGMTPHEYFKKVTDLTTKGKKINYIQAVFDATLCRNIIVQIGFGIGQLKIEGGSKITDLYFMPSHSELDIHLFNRLTIEEWLTFDWFKLNYMCKEQYWICNIM